METRYISDNGYTVYELPAPVRLPAGWHVRGVMGLSGPMVVGEPDGLEPYGVPRPGHDPHFAPERHYHWPPVPVRSTVEEAERDRCRRPAGLEVDVVVPFPLGGFICYQTGVGLVEPGRDRLAIATAAMAAFLETWMRKP